MYSIDFSKLIRRDLPFALRKTKVLAWLLALISPVISLYSAFINYRERTNLDLMVTGQVRILRHHLNRRFDVGENRIQILDGDSNAIVYIFLESENQPVYLTEFLSGSTVDFVVKVPIDLKPVLPQIKAFLNRFKLASKRYRIDLI